jgi:hypothetical protein
MSFGAFRDFGWKVPTPRTRVVTDFRWFEGVALMAVTKTAPILFACAVIAASSAARATPIVYTESDVLRVTIGASVQLVGTLTLREVADTSAIATFAPGILVNPGTVTFSLNAGASGIFTGTFTDSMHVFDNQNTDEVGFNDATLPSDVVDTTNSQFGSYGLATLLGPISGTANFGSAYPTTAGTLTLLSSPTDRNDATFTASAVPEPATLTVLTVGLLSLGQARRRRSR